MFIIKKQQAGNRIHCKNSLKPVTGWNAEERMDTAKRNQSQCVHSKEDKKRKREIKALWLNHNTRHTFSQPKPCWHRSSLSKSYMSWQQKMSALLKCCPPYLIPCFLLFCLTYSVVKSMWCHCSNEWNEASHLLALIRWTVLLQHRGADCLSSTVC